VFTDVLALGLSLGAALLTTRKPTKRHTFGLHRVEILVALVNGVTFIVLAIFDVRLAPVIAIAIIVRSF
jgi:cobalt-zinc-cadmium efflux system protein